MDNLKILIIGMPDLVIYCIQELIQKGKNIIGVITSPKEHVTYSMMEKFLKTNKINHIHHNCNFKDEKLLKEIKNLNPDVAIVCSFNYLLPEELYSIPKFGTFNIHPSLLPNYRGANPYSHVILNKETKTGVTFHYMDKTFDTGDIVLQRTIPVLSSDTMGTLFKRMNDLSKEMCIELLSMIEKGQELPRTKQDNSKNYIKAPKIKELSEETFINWKDTADNIERQTRALAPFILTNCKFRNDIFTIQYSISYPTYDTSGFEAGQICGIEGNYIYIATGLGAICPVLFRYKNQNYFAMDGSISFDCKVGEKFN